MSRLTTSALRRRRNMIFLNVPELSVYKTGDADLLVKVVDMGANGSYDGGPGQGDDTEGTFTVTTATQDDWTEVSINISDLNGLGNSGQNVEQIVFDIVGDNTETIYIDDIYYAV